MKSNPRTTTVLESLNFWLKQAMLSDDRVLLMGEDILDPYGGAFKVTRTLSDAFPDRVISTPISEAGIIGVATGLALRGFRPVVEIMFGDFSTLIADQVINHLSKFSSMYMGIDMCPVIIRTPMGGRRGYGPTHSQTIEKLYFGIPSLKVVAPCSFYGGAGELLYNAVINQNDPVFFVENKLQYLLEILEKDGSQEIDVEMVSGDDSEQNFPVFKAGIRGAPKPELTIITYGYMTELACQAMVELAYQEEVFVEILTFTQLSPLKIPENAYQYLSDRNLLILEEGSRGWGWGAEVAAKICERYRCRHGKLLRMAAKDEVIPASPVLEKKVLPQVADIIQTIMTMRGGG